jgi:hypothetical protein
LGIRNPVAPRRGAAPGRSSPCCGSSLALGPIAGSRFNDSTWGSVGILVPSESAAGTLQARGARYLRYFVRFDFVKTKSALFQNRLPVIFQKVFDMWRRRQQKIYAKKEPLCRGVLNSIINKIKLSAFFQDAVYLLDYGFHYGKLHFMQAEGARCNIEGFILKTHFHRIHPDRFDVGKSLFLDFPIGDLEHIRREIQSRNHVFVIVFRDQQRAVARAEADIQNPQVVIGYETSQAMPRACLRVEMKKDLHKIIEE